MNDYGCPTCGSKNFGTVEMKKNGEGAVTWKKQCYNCKKFWHGSNF
jgi:transcriptional regulator NrdR family protein